MRLLAIESSCDETAAAVVEDGRQVHSNVIASQIQAHKVYGGVVPEIASRMHIEAISGVVEQALLQAKTPLDAIDAVAVTYAPGLIGALLVGVNFAKGLALGKGIPLVPVHHLRAHVAANYLTHPDLQPPFLCLVVSGGHTHIIQVTDYTQFRVVGLTRDDAAGEALDKVARALGLAYPGGVNLDRQSLTGDAQAHTFPRPKVDSAYDFSFSGLKTAAINQLHTAAQRGETVSLADFGASYIQAVVGYLCENTLRAARDTNAKTIVLAGGVSANSRLREQMQQLCDRQGIRLVLPQLQYCTDNAAMVGAQGYYELLAGHTADMRLNAAATRSIEQG